MTVHTELDSATGERKLRFTVGDDRHDGPISVVGSFNHWTPGIDVLEPQPDGTRSVSVVVDPAADVHFRYLGSGGTWFDDDDAETTEYGSVIRAEIAASTSSQSAATERSAPSGPASTGRKAKG